MSIPWWTKLGAKLVLSRLPLGYTIWQRLGCFRHGAMDDAAYAMRVFDTHVERARLTGTLAGRTILELGPGDSVASAVIAAAHGAQCVLVDAGRFVRSDIAPYLELTAALQARGLTAPDLAGCDDVDALLARCRARYLTAGLASLRQIADASIDLIFSQAVLEHVRQREFLPMMHECRRVLKPGGVCSHQVDLKDHLSGGLNNLRFSERTWESDFFTKSGFYTNRIQYRRMLRLFQEAGFDAEPNARRWTALPTPRRVMAQEFRSVPDDELCVSGFDVLLRPRSAETSSR